MTNTDLMNSIINVLKDNPKGIMAKNIANKIPGTSKKSINQVLYSNPNVFVSADYTWFLRERTQISKGKYEINRVDLLSFARHVHYLKPSEIDELVSLQGKSFDNLSKNIMLLRKAKAFKYLQDFSVFKKFITLPADNFSEAFYNAMVLGYGFDIRTLNDTQWLTFITRSKAEFSAVLNHAIAIRNTPQLNNMLFTNWLEMVSLDDETFNNKLNSLRIAYQRTYRSTSSSSGNTSYQRDQTSSIRVELFTKCTGICSNCDRDVCIETR